MHSIFPNKINSWNNHSFFFAEISLNFHAKQNKTWYQAILPNTNLYHDLTSPSILKLEQKKKNTPIVIISLKQTLISLTNDKGKN
jgi:hypothetical protein